MAFYTIHNVAVSGLTVCVPKNVEDNMSLPNFEPEEAKRIIDSTGVKQKRVVDDHTTPSDLCTKAAERLMEMMEWDRESIDCLVFVSTNRDYLQPTTSCVIHNSLGLKESCFAIDVPCGCPGWVYGLYIMGTFLQTGQMKRGLLLVGDTSTKMNYPLDKSARPLFGDAGTATAMEYREGAPEMQFNIATISSGWNEIITKEGGARTPFNENSLKVEQGADGYLHRPIDCVMNGMNVFAFSLSTPSKMIKQLVEQFAIDTQMIDYFLCHQANKYIVDKIRKKAGFDAEKTPICLDEFGNTSNASIPLCIVSRCAEAFANQKQDVLAVAFGTGLMCGVAHIQFDQLKNEMIEY